MRTLVIIHGFQEERLQAPETHHRLVMDSVQSVRERWGRQVMDVATLSAGLGLTGSDERIVAYDAALEQFDEAASEEMTAHFQVPGQTTALVRDYDLAFYLLGGSYLQALGLGLPLDQPEPAQQIVLTDQESLALVPSGPNLHLIIAAGSTAARRWHVPALYVRGFLFKRLCGQVVQHGPALLEWLCHRPQDTERLFYKRARWRPQWRLW